MQIRIGLILKKAEKLRNNDYVETLNSHKEKLRSHKGVVLQSWQRLKQIPHKVKQMSVTRTILKFVQMENANLRLMRNSLSVCLKL